MIIRVCNCLPCLPSHCFELALGGAYARSAQMPCLVDFYDCLRAWANPKSVGYPPWKKGKLDCHEYYYEEFLTKPMAVQQKGGH